MNRFLFWSPFCRVASLYPQSGRTLKTKIVNHRKLLFMKKQGNPSPDTSGHSSNASQPAKATISEDAFYLIALSVLLKQMIHPASLQDVLIPRKYADFPDKLSGLTVSDRAQ